MRRLMRFLFGGWAVAAAMYFLGAPAEVTLFAWVFYALGFIVAQERALDELLDIVWFWRRDAYEVYRPTAKEYISSWVDKGDGVEFTSDYYGSPRPPKRFSHEDAVRKAEWLNTKGDWMTKKKVGWKVRKWRGLRERY